MDRDDNYLISLDQKSRSYRVLNILEFNSKRKRMSVILKSPENKIIILTKGADSIVGQRLRQGQEEQLRDAMRALEEFGKEGLRTLMLAQREVENEEYRLWSQEYNKAATSMQNREKLVEDMQDKIEINLELVGCTAIEDKLQDEVPETIDLLMKANIKTWVLTGDKGNSI